MAMVQSVARRGARSVATAQLGMHLFSVSCCSPAALGVGTARTAATLKKGEKEAASYWGVAPARLVKEDGTEWKWPCFRPWDAYEADVSIDLKKQWRTQGVCQKHHRPATLGDKVALWTVKAMRWPTDLFFQSLRRFEQSGGWIRPLLEEAENERMHLMTFMEVSQPRWYERALVVAVQGVFFHAYLATYLASPKVAHRMVGYLEEEAVHSYTEFLRDLEAGKIDDVPAPTRRTTGTSNHYASDIHCQGHALREVAAPIGYH
ncbi:hypothetical protein CFC21_039778 [Triticum aestivum]|uniref:Ubiquinol oxidase n=3 Tax=Triticum TaxID=4564 RepID=A0A077RFF4_WHEAT|nr:hypothetical protein CFC21_039778 [Triticum aestivum]CDJ26408.1 unnamed protein product [Triticum aestivum]VAH72471.1 unnamed protein product [Triticum turgidum subsp. durum]